MSTARQTALQDISEETKISRESQDTSTFDNYIVGTSHIINRKHYFKNTD